MIDKYSEEIVVINGIFIALPTVTFVTDLHGVGQQGYGDVRWGFTVKSAFNDATVRSKDSIEYWLYDDEDLVKEYESKKQEFSIIHQEFINLWNEYLENNK